jgi:hypothetical protein
VGSLINVSGAWSNGPSYNSRFECQHIGSDLLLLTSTLNCTCSPGFPVYIGRKFVRKLNDLQILFFKSSYACLGKVPPYLLLLSLPLLLVVTSKCCQVSTFTLSFFSTFLKTSLHRNWLIKNV